MRISYILSLTEMAMLEEHPVFDPAIKMSNQQQKEKKKAPPPQPQETTLNLSLLEKPDGTAKEEKGLKVVQQIYSITLLRIMTIHCAIVKFWW